MHCAMDPATESFLHEQMAINMHADWITVTNVSTYMSIHIAKEWANDEHKLRMLANKSRAKVTASASDVADIIRIHHDVFCAASIVIPYTVGICLNANLIEQIVWVALARVLKGAVDLKAASIALLSLGK
jgi:hypothetical protein